jgi:hypothetical protein
MLLEPLGISPPRNASTTPWSPAMTVSELARQLGIPRARTARAMPVLTAKGLLTRLPGRAARFSAVGPAVAAGALAPNHEQALAPGARPGAAGAPSAPHQGTAPGRCADPSQPGMAATHRPV